MTLPAGGEIEIPADTEERALYVAEGSVGIAGDTFGQDQLLVFRPGDRIVVTSERGASFALLGGASLGSRRYIWWNFVSSSRERIEQAKDGMEEPPLRHRARRRRRVHPAARALSRVPPRLTHSSPYALGRGLPSLFSKDLPRFFARK